MKTCSKCKETKQATEFYKDARIRDGLTSACKVCVKIVRDRYYAANPEALIAVGAKYYANNKLKINARTAKYRAKNTEKVAAATTRYRADNLDKIKAKNTKWWAENPEAVRIYSHNRRARKLAAGGKISKGLFDLKIIKGRIEESEERELLRLSREAKNLKKEGRLSVLRSFRDFR